MAVINGVSRQQHAPETGRGGVPGLCPVRLLCAADLVNGADTKSAQMFTLAHELAHVWIGREGISGFEGLFPDHGEVERFCNHVAAEFLVPARELHACWAEARAAAQPYEFLARRFKVSPVVAARRAMDLRLISREAFFAFYRDYTAQERHLEVRRKEQGKSGGDFTTTRTRGWARGLRWKCSGGEGGAGDVHEAYRLTDWGCGL